MHVHIHMQRCPITICTFVVVPDILCTYIKKYNAVRDMHVQIFTSYIHVHVQKEILKTLKTFLHFISKKLLFKLVRLVILLSLKNIFKYIYLYCIIEIYIYIFVI